MPSLQHVEANMGQFAGTALPPPASPPPLFCGIAVAPCGLGRSAALPPPCFSPSLAFPLSPFWFAVAPGGVFFPLPLSPPPPYFLVYTPA